MDAASLAEDLILLWQQGKDIGLHENLRHYERWRKAEAAKMIAAMQGFRELFDGANPLKKLVRGIGMVAADTLPGVKQQFMLRALGLEGDLPALAKSQ